MYRNVILAAAATLAITMPSMAQAYIGPGMGVGAITAVFGVLGALFLAVIGLVWYPVKRMIKGRRTGAAKTEAQAGQ